MYSTTVVYTILYAYSYIQLYSYVLELKKNTVVLYERTDIILQ